MLALDGDQLGPAQRAGIAEQQQGAVAQVGQAPGAAGGDQPLDLGRSERGGPAGRPAVFAVDAAQGVVDHRVIGGEVLAG